MTLPSDKMKALPHGFERLAMFHAAGWDSVSYRLAQINRDFQENGELYETRKMDDDSTSLHFSLNGSEYSLPAILEFVHETLKETLREEEYPVLASDHIKLYVNSESRIPDKEVLFSFSSLTRNCIEISIILRRENEFVSMLEVWSSLNERICVYDFISYHRYFASELGLIDCIEKINPGQLSRDNAQRIIDVLRKTLINIDTAMETYLFSERSVVANVAASFLTSIEEINEAKKTIRYLDVIIK